MSKNQSTENKDWVNMYFNTTIFSNGLMSQAELANYSFSVSKHYNHTIRLSSVCQPSSIPIIFPLECTVYISPSPLPPSLFTSLSTSHYVGHSHSKVIPWGLLMPMLSSPSSSVYLGQPDLSTLHPSSTHLLANLQMVPYFPSFRSKSLM